MSSGDEPCPGCALFSTLWVFSSRALFGVETTHKVLLRDVTQIEGVRDNQLVGYGLVIGLAVPATRSKHSLPCRRWPTRCTRMGVQIAPGVVVVKNVAAVFVTADLAAVRTAGNESRRRRFRPWATPRASFGGVLLLTALRSANGQVYAEAQGPLVIGGYTEGAAGNIRSVNHPTVGRIAEGGIVEREAAVDLSRFRIVSLLLLNSDFTAARDIADVINQEFGKPSPPRSTATASTSMWPKVARLPCPSSFPACRTSLSISVLRRRSSSTNAPAPS